MIYQNDFLKRVLIEPLEIGADKLKIVSGYASPSMVSWHITEIAEQKKPPIEISLIVGMCKADGLTTSAHDGFKTVMNRQSDNSTFICQYVVDGTPVHSKIYVWEKSGVPIIAYMGSANYSQIAFSRARREILQECDPIQALNYFNTIEANSMYCNHADIEEFVQFSRAVRYTANETFSSSTQSSNSIKLSLLDYKGEMHEKSGLNWGQRPGRNKNQAYIPLPVAHARSGFFPLDKAHFSVLTDDNKNLILRVEQQNNKAITTPLNNSHIGEYFRNRLGLPSGAFVTKQDLTNYGRTDVEFIKWDEEQFFMNFSNNSSDLSSRG